MRDRDSNSSSSFSSSAATAAAAATTTANTSSSSAASQFAARIEALRVKDQRWQLLVGVFGCVFALLIVVMGAISTFHSTPTSTLGASGLASPHGALRGALLPSASAAASDAAAVLSSQSSGSRDLSFANHLVMVAGHAVLDNDRCGADLLTDAAWVLLDYQRNQGLPEAFVAHIRAGVMAARADPRALLIFSGGHTREASPDGEAMSYYNVAHHFDWWLDDASSGRKFAGSAAAAAAAPTPTDGVALLPVSRRTFLEDFSRDSFENVLFSIARFKEITGHYPEAITTVSFSFKHARFEDLHRVALRWPKDKFHFIGIDPTSDRFDYARAAEGERKNAREPFETDPYGCSHEVLKSKREGRNPYFRTAPYALSCPDLAPLLAWCSDTLYDGWLPWDLRT